METYSFPHFPSSINSLNIALFHSIPSPDQLLDQLLNSSTPNQNEFAFIDSSRIVSRDHLLTACHQAMIAASNHISNQKQVQVQAIEGEGEVASGNPSGKGGMRARNLHAEILWKLSPSTNVSS